MAGYLRAFESIEADPHQYLAVARRQGRIVGTFQLSIIPGLARHGTTRAQLEAVRVDPDERGTSLGTELVLWAQHEARGRSCGLSQLTSDTTREDPHRFYERLGRGDTYCELKKDAG